MGNVLEKDEFFDVGIDHLFGFFTLGKPDASYWFREAATW
jgi:hypothetical protein